MSTILELDKPPATQCKIVRINILLIPNSPTAIPQLQVQLAFGTTTQGDNPEFIPAYSKVLTISGEKFDVFLQQFGTLEAAFMQYLINIGELRGTVR